jgi:hypothetical protein
MIAIIVRIGKPAILKYKVCAFTKKSDMAFSIYSAVHEFSMSCISQPKNPLETTIGERTLRQPVKINVIRACKFTINKIEVSPSGTTKFLLGEIRILDRYALRTGFLETQFCILKIVIYLAEVFDFRHGTSSC